MRFNVRSTVSISSFMSIGLRMNAAAPRSTLSVCHPQAQAVCVLSLALRNFPTEHGADANRKPAMVPPNPAEARLAQAPRRGNTVERVARTEPTRNSACSKRPKSGG